MAKSYRTVDRDQDFLLPPSMLEWLPEDHLVWFVIEAVERLDTSAFHQLSKLGGTGRRGYDPQMLLTLLVYAMAHGESSSRQIERLCHSDVAFRIICAQDVPDHTVLARFRQRHQQALEDLLTASLELAAELGMVSLGVVAFDGTKIAGNASKQANRSEKYLRRLAEGYLREVDQNDQVEDGLFGAGRRGDELPPSVTDRTNRPGRIDAALTQIQARHDRAAAAQREADERIRAAEQAAAQGVSRPGRYPKGGDRVIFAKARWQRARDRAAARYEQWSTNRALGIPQPGKPAVPPDEHNRVRKAWKQYQDEIAAANAKDTAGEGEHGTALDAEATPAGGEEGKGFTANLTDPDSRILKTRNGWVQGYNCQTAASEDGFILYAQAIQDANDVEQFVPTMTAVVATATRLAEHSGRGDLARVGIMLADAGYDSNANLTAQGPARLIADGKGWAMESRATHQAVTGDVAEEPSAREAMNHRLRTPEGLALYRRRSHIIEAPNAWLKDGRGLRAFSRRGLAAAQSELSFASAVTNLMKIATGGITAAQLSTA